MAERLAGDWLKNPLDAVVGSAYIALDRDERFLLLWFVSWITIFGLHRDGAKQSKLS